jgi:hypothetical protein
MARYYTLRNDILVVLSVIGRHGLGREMIREMSKNDYNFSVLLVLLVVILGITGIAALGALMMFMTAFM